MYSFFRYQLDAAVVLIQRRELLPRTYQPGLLLIKKSGRDKKFFLLVPELSRCLPGKFFEHRIKRRL